MDLTAVVFYLSYNNSHVSRSHSSTQQYTTPAIQQQIVLLTSCLVCCSWCVQCSAKYLQSQAHLRATIKHAVDDTWYVLYVSAQRNTFYRIMCSTFSPWV